MLATYIGKKKKRRVGDIRVADRGMNGTYEYKTHDLIRCHARDVGVERDEVARALVHAQLEGIARVDVDKIVGEVGKAVSGAATEPTAMRPRQCNDSIFGPGLGTNSSGNVLFKKNGSMFAASAVSS